LHGGAFAAVRETRIEEGKLKKGRKKRARFGEEEKTRRENCREIFQGFT
jgi:hypothetical protein